MNYDFDLYEKIKCSDKEKKECEKIIEKIVYYAQKARRQGLLALEKDAEEYEFSLIKIGLQLISDGTDPDITLKILENYIFSSPFRGFELLKRILIMEGTLCIQSGDNPMFVYEKLISLMGEEYAFKLKREKLEQEQDYERKKAELNNFLETIKSRDITSPKPEFDIVFKGMEGRCIQRCLREIESMHLCLALKACSSDVFILLLRNMSTQSAINCKENIEIMGPVREADIIEVQEKILEIVKKLEDTGEIIVNRTGEKFYV